MRNYDYGPVERPLPINGRKTFFELSNTPGTAKLNQRIADGRMRRFRSVPTLRRVWYVTLTATEVNSNLFAPGQLVSGLSFEPRAFWLHARRVAYRLLEIDHANGGSGSAFAVECRRCKVCRRMLVAAEASTYRERERRPKRTWQFKQGPACSVDCKPVIIRNSKNRRRECQASASSA